MIGIRTRGVLTNRRCFGIASSLNSEQSHRVTKKVSASPQLLFEIVSDVQKYNEFVPFVLKSFINKYDDQTKLPTEAGLRVGFKLYDEEFTCQLQCEKNAKVIAESTSILLFENLWNEWKFKEVKNGYSNEATTLVEVNLRYKFKNPLYNAVASLFQDQVSNIMIQAFEQRAKDLKAQGEK